MAKPKIKNALDQKKYRRRKRERGLCAHPGCESASAKYYCQLHARLRAFQKMATRKGQR